MFQKEQTSIQMQQLLTTNTIQSLGCFSLYVHFLRLQPQGKLVTIHKLHQQASQHYATAAFQNPAHT